MRLFLLEDFIQKKIKESKNYAARENFNSKVLEYKNKDIKELCSIYNYLLEDPINDLYSEYFHLKRNNHKLSKILIIPETGEVYYLP